MTVAHEEDGTHLLLSDNRAVSKGGMLVLPPWGVAIAEVDNFQ